MKVRKPHFYEALLSFGCLMLVMGVGIAVFGANPHIPMLIGTAIAAVIALKIGYDWKTIEESMFDGIRQALQAVVILAIIGVLIGIWILSGVVPSMIYYGLNILTPKIFLVAAVIICSITSLATGTSWGTAGTIGIALMGIAQGMGIPAPVAAGAIISGAYFGDKMSPLSDTTNLAPAMAGTDVFTHVKFMLRPTIVAYTITLVFFGIMGVKYGGASADLSAIITMKEGLMANFTISPVLLIPPIAVIVAISRKVPAIPGIFLGIILGAILGPIMQGVDFGQILSAAYDGFISETGVEAIDDLLSAGGLSNMMYSISLTILAMMFGGIMEKTGQLEVIVEKLLKGIKTAHGLVVLTIATCFGSNLTMPEQYIAIVLPGRMYAKAYREMGLHPKTLSNALESAGTLTSALIPWNTCGVFLLGVLGVSTLEYAPYAIFNYTMPLVVIVMSYFGLVIARIEDEPDTVLESA
ncbi:MULTISPECIES: Na+/H+ antiporter NhaC [unclassified Fusibacter]|uniref:Na+/H+ antiporter NhaC n=1 Tax=unclassified Fusibacter TaxID=2624464 RepID=UPI0010134BB7|nr:MULTISPECIES: Na+/H+ antiporter NhaC [unclassified Fusibacter]MCK8060632.1 Na+/H+ antiporter NhaC [Fusibacter sp. A2]NPE22914.1 Na+/H+ antiporter NhaC [Fusibacter sp. A1]RXV59981.1 Na+/H+ antiporter NhaC [Fusibacter sp. A1]